MVVLEAPLPDYGKDRRRVKKIIPEGVRNISIKDLSKIKIVDFEKKTDAMIRQICSSRSRRSEKNETRNISTRKTKEIVKININVKKTKIQAKAARVKTEPPRRLARINRRNA